MLLTSTVFFSQMAMFFAKECIEFNRLIDEQSLARAVFAGHENVVALFEDIRGKTLEQRSRALEVARNS